MSETCGCCSGLEALTPLAAANRPGLDALVYRAGTHATFLETMKARLSAGEHPELAGLTTRGADDPSIALLDAWATVADVLTFYGERIANEGYLRTATERRSIAELARLVGYVPRPGVAASVYLALTLEDGYETEIPAGTRAQSLPGPGELPQFFETAEALEARAEWNLLTPRSSRPQVPRPVTRPKEDVPRGRLYLKGVATNLGPNDPLLVDLGARQQLVKVLTVEPDPEKDRTLVTLAPVAVRPARQPPTRPEPGDRLGNRAEDLRQTVEGYLDVGAQGVSPVRDMTQRVVGLLEDFRSRLTPEAPPEELAASLRERILPGLRQDLDTARELNYTRLTSWLEQIEVGLREIEGELSAVERPEMIRPSAVGPADVRIVAPGLGGPIPAENGGSGNGQTPSVTLEGLLDRLAKPPSEQPVGPAKLPRTLEKSFGAESDAVPRLLTALRPELGDELYRAWEQTGAEPGEVRVYALRVTAAPFGHNAPPTPVLEDGRIVGYEEWTLERSRFLGTEGFGVDIRTGQSGEDDYRIQVTVTLGGESASRGSQKLQNGSFLLDLPRVEETIAGTISDVADERFRLRLVFRNRGTVVDIKDRVDGEVIGIGGPRAADSPSTEISVDIGWGDQFEVTSDGSDPTAVALGFDDFEDRQILVSGELRNRSVEATEEANAVSLDASYKQILPESWVVVERPYGAGTVPQRLISRVEGVGEASRTDYGIAAQGTRISLPQDRPWLDLDLDDFAVIRGTSVYAASELLELAEAPPEVVAADGSVKLEPVAGGRIELDALYDGLEPGRWLFVTGERDDLPGVSASELVMLAGVEQGVRQVDLATEDLQRLQDGGGQAITLSGRGSTGPGGYDLTIAARLFPDGSATGYAHLAGGATGEVIGVDPPRVEKDFWCINVRRSDTGPESGDQRINLYVRDVGDGAKTFDEISFVSSMGGDCARFPEPLGTWLRLAEGDFRAAVDQPDEKVHSTLVLASDLAYPYKRESVKIYGNVARATHGETRGEVLGSGDAGGAFQKFGLKQSPLTHVAATTPRGVESSLKVYVDDVRWHEADHLAGLQPTDRRFVTQTSDAGEVAVVFGDGSRGARLPTGVENVRAVYRTGIGKAGNVAAGQISLLATRPLGLKGVINPLPATGGADRETRDQARRNAPLAVKVLDRLVSVRDYEDFARAFAGVGKASATRLSDGRRQLVHLTIAGADDIPIAGDSDLYRHLLQALQRFGDPQQPLRVDVRELILMIVSARVSLLPDYLWESVEPEIRAAAVEIFGFERREMGQDAHLSEVIGTIQRVPGVSYVDVDTFGGIPEKTVDVGTRLRRPLLPGEIAAEITRLVKGEGQPLQRIPVALAGSDGGSIRPAQLAFLTPRVPDTLILKEITS